MDSKGESSEQCIMRNKCAACYKQYNRLEHLVEHMKTAYHSIHEPMCGICKKHCRSFESLREHLIGPLPKVECAKVFTATGCNLCLSIFDSPYALRSHRGSCHFSRAFLENAQVSRLNILSINENMNYIDGRKRLEGPEIVAMGCKMVGGGSDGSLDLCARVCLIDEYERIIFHTYVKPQIPITNFRHEVTGMRAEHMTDAMPLKQAQRRIQNFLCNGEALWKIKSVVGKARILVGHGLDHDLDCIGIEYPSLLIRDTAKYPPLMKSSKLNNSLKYLTQAYLGYDIQTGVQDPYEDCVATMRLYMRMRNQAHCNGSNPTPSEFVSNRSIFSNYRPKDLEKMSPDQLLEMSRSDYYCWCMDSKLAMDG